MHVHVVCPLLRYAHYTSCSVILISCIVCNAFAVNTRDRKCWYTSIYFRASIFRERFTVASCCAKSNQIHDWITLVAIPYVQQVSCLISHFFLSGFHPSLHVKPSTLSGWLDLEPVWLDLGPFWLCVCMCYECACAMSARRGRLSGQKACSGLDAGLT